MRVLLIYKLWRQDTVANLVKLVNETDAFIGQHQSPGFQRPLPGHGIALNVRGQTDSRSALTRREHHPRRSLLDVLEELRLRCAGVAADQNVYVASDLVLTT